MEELEAARRRAAARPAARVPLQHFLRLIAGGGALVEMADPRGGPASNDELVELLRRGGALTSDAVARAMRLTPRDAFVPHAHAAEALMDAPM